jgi:RND family efflux transporter MFP subunit
MRISQSTLQPTYQIKRNPLFTAIAISVLVFGAFSVVLASNSHAQTPSSIKLKTVSVRSGSSDSQIRVDGVVEAVRYTQISPQISGAIVKLPVQAGDVIKIGQLLASVDARAAQQNANASNAQVEAARASLMIAEKDYARQKLLFEKNFISQAQLDRALSQFNASNAQAKAQIAQAAAVQTQSSFYTIQAPYNGIVSNMHSAVGDMAMPGQPIMTVYDPTEMRVIINVPQTHIAYLKANQELLITFPSLPENQRTIKVQKFTLLPATDATTHTAQIRVDLPKNMKGLSPGLFAQTELTINNANKNSHQTTDAARLYVPTTAIIKRAQFQAVYVVNAQGKALLRQIKAGPIMGNEQEVLSGVSQGELVATNPLAAALATLPTQ